MYTFIDKIYNEEFYLLYNKIVNISFYSFGESSIYLFNQFTKPG